MEKVNIYNQLVKRPVFTIEEVVKQTGKTKTAYYKLECLIKKGLVKKIRKNIYSAVDQENGHVIGTRYQIACAITETAYISHHSSFEYYGIASHVFDEVYVSSESKYNSFQYEYVTYKYVASRMQEGIVDNMNTTGVRVTDLERTVIDSIHDYSKTGGFQMLITCLEKIHYIDENKLKRYLEIYNIQGLYQRVGFILNHYQENMKLSKEFIDYCKSKIGKSRRYLINEFTEDNIYNSEWELMVPEQPFKGLEQGG